MAVIVTGRLSFVELYYGDFNIGFYYLFRFILSIGFTWYLSMIAYGLGEVIEKNTSSEDSDQTKKEDAISRSEKLARLYEQGLITEDEYMKKRAKIINRL